LGVEQDFVEAVAWFRKAAEQDYGEAQYLMGVAFEYGEGVAQDIDEAKKWYEKAVSNGSGNASGSLYRLEGYKR
jgi:TPR repeat protein